MREESRLDEGLPDMRRLRVSALERFALLRASKADCKSGEQAHESHQVLGCSPTCVSSPYLAARLADRRVSAGRSRTQACPSRPGRHPAVGRLHRMVRPVPHFVVCHHRGAVDDSLTQSGFALACLSLELASASRALPVSASAIYYCPLRPAASPDCDFPRLSRQARPSTARP